MFRSGLFRLTQVTSVEVWLFRVRTGYVRLVNISGIKRTFQIR